MLKWLKIAAMVIMINNMILTPFLKAEDKDPFISIIDLQKEKFAAQKSLKEMTLKGIIWNESKAVAIINDELLMAGDDWEGFKVERIDKDGVTLSDKEGSYKLYVEETGEGATGASSSGAPAAASTGASEKGFSVPPLEPPKDFPGSEGLSFDVPSREGNQ